LYCVWIVFNFDEEPIKLANDLPYIGSLPLFLYIVFTSYGIFLSNTIVHYLFDTVLIKSIYEHNGIYYGYWKNF
jgi:hypothetical protein